MTIPQTEIEKLENKINQIKKNGCCAFSTIWALGLDNMSNEEAWKKLIMAIDTKSLDSDCTVNWKPFAKFLTDEDYDVEMIDLQNQTMDELKAYEGRIIVRFDNGLNYHWVGVENGKVAFNSLEKSYCVMYGRPTKVRVLKKV